MEDFFEQIGEYLQMVFIMTLCAIGYASVWFVYLTSGIAITPNPDSLESFEKQMSWNI